MKFPQLKRQKLSEVRPQAGPEQSNTQEHKEEHKNLRAARPRKLKIRGPIYHSIYRFRRLSRHQQRKQVRVGLLLLALMIVITGIVIYKDYHERPGILERSSLKAVEAGTDFLS